ncbi:putative galactinol--sucrose galactosyltransferase 1 [Raphanus sativus]|nr:putative galactinol--sucrose galactosyltransferase 1 [Raphanus sativus]
MTVGAGISVSNSDLLVLGPPCSSRVPENVLVTPASGNALMDGAFIGVSSDQTGSRRVFPLGKLEELRFMCVFRFKLWWMTQRMGTHGKEIPFETQFLIVEANQELFFKGTNPELEICLESGDPTVDQFKGVIWFSMAAGSDPFHVITKAVKAVEQHLQTFSHRERKKMPDMLNWFGWCTWEPSTPMSQPVTSNKVFKASRPVGFPQNLS